MASALAPADVRSDLRDLNAQLAGVHRELAYRLARRAVLLERLQRAMYASPVSHAGKTLVLDFAASEIDFGGGEGVPAEYDGLVYHAPTSDVSLRCVDGTSIVCNPRGSRIVVELVVTARMVSADGGVRFAFMYKGRRGILPRAGAAARRVTNAAGAGLALEQDTGSGGEDETWNVVG